MVPWVPQMVSEVVPWSSKWSHGATKWSHGDPMDPQSGPLGAPRGPMGSHGDPPNDIFKMCTILNISHGDPKWSHGCPKWSQLDPNLVQLVSKWSPNHRVPGSLENEVPGTPVFSQLFELKWSRLAPKRS